MALSWSMLQAGRDGDYTAIVQVEPQPGVDQDGVPRAQLQRWTVTHKPSGRRAGTGLEVTLLGAMVSAQACVDEDRGGVAVAKGGRGSAS